MQLSQGSPVLRVGSSLEVTLGKIEPLPKMGEIAFQRLMGEIGEVSLISLLNQHHCTTVKGCTIFSLSFSGEAVCFQKDSPGRFGDAQDQPCNGALSLRPFDLGPLYKLRCLVGVTGCFETA